MWDGYRIYASVILGTSLLGIIVELYTAKKNLINLRNMSKLEVTVNVFRNVKGLVQ